MRGAWVTTVNMIICYSCGFDMDFKPSKVSLKSLNTRNLIMFYHGAACALVQFSLPLPVVNIIGCCSAIFVSIIDYYRHGIRLNH